MNSESSGPAALSCEEMRQGRLLEQIEHWENPDVVNFLDDPGQRGFRDFDDRFYNVFMGTAQQEEMLARRERLSAMLADNETTLGDLVDLYKEMCEETLETCGLSFKRTRIHF